MEIITYSEAKLKGLKKYFTNVACKNNHISERLTSNGSCIECLKENKKKESAKEKENLRRRKDRQENNVEYREKDKLRRLNNIDKMRDRDRKRHEKRKSQQQEWLKNDRKKHPWKYLLRGKERKEKIKQATPSWLSKDDRENIKYIYQKSYEVSLQTGIKHHVDHIVPIKGETVCGLHVPWNLQIMTERENLSKSNKWEV